MCNRYSNRIGYRDYVDVLRELGIELLSPSPDAAPNLEPQDNIRPTDRARVLRPVEGGLELRQLRWGLIPRYHTKTVKEWTMLTTNARSETLFTNAVYRHAAQSRRCLVPADEFYEWTGPKGKKTKWAFRVKNADWFCFAGIWDRANQRDGDIESFALTTMPSGPDMQAYHDRQPVILGCHQYAAWLDPKVSIGPLLAPPPPGIIVATRMD